MNTRLALSSLLLSMLAACGGGSSTVAGGVGTGGTGITWGTVSGFGSVIIDGVEYDDSQAAIQQGSASGNAQDTLAAIGQQVQLTHDSQGHAQHIRVTPQLLGPAANVSATSMTVMGQSVAIVAAQTVVSDAPQAGDWVRVFGQWTTSSGGQQQLNATRVERIQPTDTSRVLISGNVASTSNANTPTVTLSNGWEVAVDNLAALNLATGASVAFWIDANTWSQTAVIALQTDSHPPTFADGDELTLEAPLARDGNGRAHLQGIQLPAGVNLPELGERTRITLKRVNGQWTLVQAPAAVPVLAAVNIKGWTDAPDWTASPLQFTLRNTTVSVPPDVLANSTCANFTSGQVRITATATRGSAPLVLTQISCSGDIQSNDVASTALTVTAYDPKTKMVTAWVNGKSETFPWPSTSQAPEQAADIVGQSINAELRRDKNGNVQAQRLNSK